MLKPFIAAIVLLASGPSRPDLAKTFDRTGSDLNAESPNTTAQDSYRISRTSTELSAGAEAQYDLARALERDKMPAAALIELMGIVAAGPSQPFYSKALEELIALQQKLGDEYLIPTLISAEPVERWAGLSAGAKARAAYLCAKVEHRKGDLAKARSLLDAVPPASEVYALSRYLLGIIEIDPRLPGGARPDRAVEAFQRVLSLSSSSQENLSRAHQLSILGLARTYYGLGEYAKSVEWYDRVPRFSQFWDQALFEAGFARFRNGDPGGALGSLQSLHAPQFEGAFQPESWVLTATIYYFHCLYDEAKASLASFGEIYPPMASALEAALSSSQDELFDAVARGERIPKPVLLWVRSNERVQGIFRILAEIDREVSALERASGSRDFSSAPDLLAALQQNRVTLRQVGGRIVRNRLEEAARNIKGFADQAGIIRFETSKAEKELAEAGTDQEKILRTQGLHRPALPSDAWQYWKFEGEFWLDEVGYYQYTLKRGCPAR
jgi:tetratricopeptide (TPR) repeat protein